MNVTLTSYAELDALVTAWAETSELTLLAIVSRPGLGKTEAAVRVAGKVGVNNLLRLDTHVTPLQLYIDCYRGRDKPIILDDLSDQILAHPVCLSILKSLCDSRRVRRLQYNSTTPLLASSGTPPEFETSSPVLILTNQFVSESPAQEALLSRAIRCDFNPSVDAVLAYVESWADRQDVLEWYCQHIGLFPAFSARDYATTCTLAKAGLNWREIAFRSTGIKSNNILVTTQKLEPLPGQSDLPF